MRKAFLFLFLSATVALNVNAQKFGYVNSQMILAELDEIKAVESELVAYREQQQKLLQTQVEAFQAEVGELQRKNNEGLLTPKQIQEEEVRLQKKQEEIIQSEQNVGVELNKRRQEKLQPILDKVNTVIETIAKEQEFTYVFDSSTGGVILYADASSDLTEQVKAKLAESN